jgi:hypothetical protein
MASNKVISKFSSIKVEDIKCNKTPMGKNKELVPLFHYGPNNNVLYIQGPWIKLKQYGLPPGPQLSNGEINKYYKSDEARDYIRFPLHADCNVQAGDNTNEKEITEFIDFLKKLDAHIKKDKTVLELIDSDDIEKYTPIHRKPGKSKTGKEKYCNMKTKFSFLKDSGKIITEFSEFNHETNSYDVLNQNGQDITIDDIEKVIKYNSEVLPIFQLVKIWTSPAGKGDWGVTLKLIKLRIKNQVYNKDTTPIAFLEDDDAIVAPSTPVKTVEKPVMPPPAPTKKQTKIDVKDEESDSDESSSDSDSEDEKPKTKATPVKSPPTKQPIADVDSDSDSESDEEPKKPPPKKGGRVKKA